MLAILPSLGFQEMFVLLVIGLLLYGRNLPEAGRTLGRITAQLRRGFNEFRDQMNRDADLGELKQTLRSTKEEIRRATAARRAIADPTRALRDLTDEALSSPLPEDEPAPAGGPPITTGEGAGTDTGEPDEEKSTRSDAG